MRNPRNEQVFVPSQIDAGTVRALLRIERERSCNWSSDCFEQKKLINVYLYAICIDIYASQEKITRPSKIDENL